MKNKKAWTKVLATAGAVLVWLPILVPVFLAVIRFVQSGRLQTDYLIPAELYLLVLIGSGLLIWAAARARRHWRAFAWGLVAGTLLLVVSQVVAVVTGLADGRIEPEGLPWVLVLGLFGAYVLAVIYIDVKAVLLLRDLFKREQLAAGSL